MAIDPHDAAGSSRLTGMIDEFRAAQKRRLVKQGIVLWTRTEEALEAIQAAGSPYAAGLSPEGK